MLGAFVDSVPRLFESNAATMNPRSAGTLGWGGLESRGRACVVERAGVCVCMRLRGLSACCVTRRPPLCPTLLPAPLAAECRSWTGRRVDRQIDR